MKYVTVVFCVIIAITCFWMGFKMVRLYFKVRSWDRVEATIIDKNVALNTKTFTSGTARYKAVINYSYTYNGKPYQGSKVYLEELVAGTRSYRKNTVEKFLNTLSDKKMIYVNASNPSESVMFCNGVGIYFFVFVMGFLSLLMGLIFLLRK